MICVSPCAFILYGMSFGHGADFALNKEITVKKIAEPLLIFRRRKGRKVLVKRTTSLFIVCNLRLSGLRPQCQISSDFIFLKSRTGNGSVQ